MPASAFNRAHRTLDHFRTTGTALTLQQRFSCTTPSKWISEARRLAARLRLRWIEGRVRIADGRLVKTYRVTRSAS